MFASLVLPPTALNQRAGQLRKLRNIKRNDNVHILCGAVLVLNPDSVGDGPDHDDVHC